MAVKDLLASLTDRLATSANVKSVYGEPIEAQGRTIVPVAKVRYAFGGGEGQEQGKDGSGGGGCVRARPVGVIEVDENGTRFVPIIDATSIAMAVGAGLAIGLLLKRR